MKDGAPFGIAGIWENWKEPASGEWVRTFAIITTDSNELVAKNPYRQGQAGRKYKPKETGLFSEA